MFQHDPSVVQSVAKRLDDRANFVVVFNGVLGLILGGIIGAVLLSESGIIGLIVGGVIGLLVGNEIGLSKSLLYKFQSQTLLTQLKIEQNTSHLPDVASATNEVYNVANEIVSIVQDIADIQSN